MKKITLILGVLISFLLTSVSANNETKTFVVSKSNISMGIKDGTYEATVTYTNFNTGTSNKYILDVKVEYNRVVKIDFGNGGSIHSGYNNENYVYSGGYLFFETDFNGNIKAATTTVTISDQSGIKNYSVRIE